MGLLTGKLFLMVGSRALDVEEMVFHFSWVAFILTVFAFLFLFLCISMFRTFMVRTNQLIDLLKAGQKPKKAPQVSLLLSLFAAVLLVASYYLATTATMQNLTFRLLPVIAMTIIGTYFFFTQLSVLAVKFLQKNRSLFWKRTNLEPLTSTLPEETT